jgi:uncharacterized protein YgiM (DUF1202 family)
MLHTGRMARGLPWRSLLVNGASGWRVVFCLVLFASLVSATITPARAATDGYIDTDILYLRSEPSPSGAVIAQMVQGDYVAVIDGPTGDGWFYIDWAGFQGWAFGAYLSIGGAPAWESEAPSAAVGGSSGTAWVNTDALNVRMGPSTGDAILGTVGQGTELEVVGDASNGFYPVSYGWDTGWVTGDYLSWSPVTTGTERWIDVDRSSGVVSLMVGNESISAFWGAMGFDLTDDGFYATANGTYYVYDKNAALTWTDWAKGYIEYFVAFDPDRFNGFHTYTMDKKGRVIEGGDGPTGGCIALDPGLAEVLYDFATFGMRVEIHW